MNYHDIKKDDMLNGDGIRVTLFVSGCEHHCFNCQNSQTWDKESGIEFNDEAFKEIVYELSKNYVSGLTLSGGDPLAKCNRNKITKIVRKVKQLYPDKTIWVYTGYKFKQVKHLYLMKYVDVLVDGKFVDELKDTTYKWAGSTNQKVIDVQESLKQNKIVLHVSK